MTNHQRMALITVFSSLVMHAGLFQSVGLHHARVQTKRPPIPYEATAYDAMIVVGSPLLVPAGFLVGADPRGVCMIPFVAAADGAAAVVVDTAMVPSDLFHHIRRPADERFWDRFEKGEGKIPSVRSLRWHDTRYTRYHASPRLAQTPDCMVRAERLIQAGVSLESLAAVNWISPDLMRRIYDRTTGSAAVAGRLGSNPALPAELVDLAIQDGRTAMLRALAHSQAPTDEQLGRMVATADSSVLCALASRPTLPPLLLRQLVDRGDWKSGRIVAKRKDLPLELAMHIATIPEIAGGLFSGESRRDWPPTVLSPALASTADDPSPSAGRRFVLNGLALQEHVTPEQLRLVWQQTPDNAGAVVRSPHAPDPLVHEIAATLLAQPDEFPLHVAKAMVPRLDPELLGQLRSRAQHEMQRKRTNTLPRDWKALIRDIDKRVSSQ